MSPRCSTLFTMGILPFYGVLALSTTVFPLESQVGEHWVIGSERVIGYSDRGRSIYLGHSLYPLRTSGLLPAAR